MALFSCGAIEYLVLATSASESGIRMTKSPLPLLQDTRDGL